MAKQNDRESTINIPLMRRMSKEEYKAFLIHNGITVVPNTLPKEFCSNCSQWQDCKDVDCWLYENRHKESEG